MPKCPKCGAELKPIYPLNLKTLWIDFYICTNPKCPNHKKALHPKTLKPIAHVV